jgi:hypothetical protein
MRTRALNGVKAVLEMKSLSPAVKKRIESLADAAAEAVKKTPLLAQVDAGTAEGIALKIRMAVLGFGKRFERDSRAGLPRIRARVLSGLGNVEGYPYFFGKAEQSELDIESELVGILEKTAGDLSATLNERLYAAKSIASFAGRPGVDGRIDQLRKQVNIELAAASSHDEREALILMLRLLGK